MRVSQKLFFSSLSSRLKYVQESLIILNRNSFYSNLNLNSEEKLLLVISLKNFFFLDEFHSFVSMKKNGFSFFLSFPLIYNLSSELMINTSLLCALDFHSDKHCFKPFRDSADVFFEIKSIFSEKLNSFVFSILKDLRIKKNLNNSWLLKNLSLERKVLCSWFNTRSYKFKSMSELQKSLYNDLYLNLINFLLYGLLWILI